jgi:hypothetical protein
VQLRSSEQGDVWDLGVPGLNFEDAEEEIGDRGSGTEIERIVVSCWWRGAEVLRSSEMTTLVKLGPSTDLRCKENVPPSLI